MEVGEKREATAEFEASGRFAFGANWQGFLTHLDDERVDIARASLVEKLGVTSLEGLHFLDLGSGSGLFSLAAIRLGAHVMSVDYDPDSVACAELLRERFAIDSSRWRIQRCDATDSAAMRQLGHFDIVYSWGVLHHTGAMWKSIENTCKAVAPGGRLFISIYNDQGRATRIWTVVKRIYQHVPAPLRPVYVLVVMGPREFRSFLRQLISGRPSRYLQSWTGYKRNRGMSRWHDLVDWAGGYPFETASPEQVFAFCRQRGFVLDELKTCGGGLGCNEFVFTLQGAAKVSR